MTTDPKILTIKDDPEHQIIEIEGVRYSYALFQLWGTNGLPVNTLFKIVKKENGLLTIEKIKEEQ